MDERTPLLNDFRGGFRDEEEGAGHDIHRQFCMLVGMTPSDLKKGGKAPVSGRSTLYGRVTKRRKHQDCVYMFTASLSNTLLLSQVVLGAALTGLGASESSHILITIFGAMNTVIAGLVAYLKSRGQPMRARMFRDDLDRVIDEIENSEIMWLGIAKDVHGYDEIAIDDSISVRSEVARLTRLYDKAVRGNTANDPDMYQGATLEGGAAALRSRPAQPALPAPPASSAPAVSAPAAVTAPAAQVADPDESGPASAPSKPKDDPPKQDPPKDDAKDDKADAAKDDAAKDDAKNDDKDDKADKSPSDAPTAESGNEATQEPTDGDSKPASTGTAVDKPGESSKPRNDSPQNGDAKPTNGDTSINSDKDSKPADSPPPSLPKAHDADAEPATR